MSIKAILWARWYRKNTAIVTKHLNCRSIGSNREPAFGRHKASHSDVIPISVLNLVGSSIGRVEPMCFGQWLVQLVEHAINSGCIESTVICQYRSCLLAFLGAYGILFVRVSLVIAFVSGIIPVCIRRCSCGESTVIRFSWASWQIQHWNGRKNTTTTPWCKARRNTWYSNFLLHWGSIGSELIKTDH
jgi:hypothetical protein